MKNKRFKYELINEAEKPKIVSNLESAFGNALWEDNKPFDINDNDMHLMFDAINDGLFGNKLNRNIPKFILKSELIASGPAKYHGMEHALAAFTSGICRSTPTEMIIVKQPRGMNFYVAVCALIHEMIHMFDYHFGPMGKQLDKYGFISMYNFNYPYVDPRTGETLPPGTSSNIKNAHITGFYDPRQMPDEIIQKIKNPNLNDKRPRQYQMPAEFYKNITDPITKEIRPVAKILPKKYTMDDIDGFYDVHGNFFMSIAQMINSYGFGINDIFDKKTPIKMTKTYESITNVPANEAETLYRFFYSDEHKGYDYQNKDNWFVEIS